MAESVSSTTIDAVAGVFLEAGLDVGEPRRRRERAVAFCEAFGGEAEARLLKCYVEREATEGRSSGLMLHFLGDATKTREVLLHMGAKPERIGRHGAGPAMDLPTSNEAKARAAGFTDPDEWVRDRAHRMMFTAWCHERKPGRETEDLEGRVEDIARDFGCTVDEAYDVLGEQAKAACRHNVELSQKRLEAARSDQASRKARRTDACLADLEHRVETARAAVEKVKTLTDYHAIELERLAEARKRHKRRASA